MQNSQFPLVNVYPTVFNSYLPSKPSPSIAHISLIAADSSLFFSSFGTLSEGVMSPTIAVMYHKIKNLLSKELSTINIL